MNTQPIPDHHKQWFEQLLRAANDGRLTLMACNDAKTGEPRSVLTLVSDDDDGGFLFTPVGHLSPEGNPYDAYIPPKAEAA